MKWLRYFNFVECFFYQVFHLVCLSLIFIHQCIFIFILVISVSKCCHPKISIYLLLNITFSCMLSSLNIYSAQKVKLNFNMVVLNFSTIWFQLIKYPTCRIHYRPYWEWRAIALARLGAHPLVLRSAIDRTPYLSKQGLKSCIPL